MEETEIMENDFSVCLAGRKCQIVEPLTPMIKLREGHPEQGEAQGPIKEVLTRGCL